MKLINNLFFLLLFTTLFSCSRPDQGKLDAVKIQIDGSSTVYPITEAIAEEFSQQSPNVKVTVGVSGTGGGFKRFLSGDIDINDASRPIKDKEKLRAQKESIQYTEFPIAYDGVSIVINKENNWVDFLTVAELKKIWEPESKVKTWKDVRATFPNVVLKLYGPGADSGTFDYFTKAINGKSRASRSNYSKSEDDNVLVRGVAGDKGAMGYFGYAYYLENKSKLKVVAVESGSGPILPSADTINSGKYAPLSRPVYIYVNDEKVKAKPALRKFVRYYFENVKNILPEIGYIPLSDQDYKKHVKHLDQL